MKDFCLVAITVGLVLVACLVVTVVTAYEVPPAELDGWVTPRAKKMRAFRSDSELRSYFRAIAERQKRKSPPAKGAGAGLADLVQKSVTLPSASLARSEVGPSSESVTNVQHAGVDEGGIVKVHGNHLVMLRRGRLFTVAIGGDALKPISVADAFGPDINPEDTWYDEMLISENTIAVIGYSYDRGGTEIGLFKIDDKGQLAYQFTYHLRSNDYYSSRNYASRLIGNKLIFYTPSYLSLESDPMQGFPAVRRWHRGAKDGEFKRIVPATRVYRPEYLIDSSYDLALHTVTVCDLANGGFACEATGAVGPTDRVFYVSPTSVYVWMSNEFGTGKDSRSQSLVYRMPLDGSAPSALRVSGSPVDQFSFLESENEQLNVVVRSESDGDGMWSAERASGDVALLRVPLSSFSDGSETAPVDTYHSLPKPDGYTFQNRYVADYLLYGSGSGWGSPVKTETGKIYAAKWTTGESHVLTLAHGVDRIEAMGSDAVVVGTDGKDLHFTSVRLAKVPEIVSSYSREGASQGELRSHGFFYKPDGDESGTVGLPIALPGRPGYEHLFEDSAAILFLRNSSLHFDKLGELLARSESAVDDRCRASCVDWYGNARPLFLSGRVFALLGYEIVEGTILDGRILERRRISYAPRRS